MKLPVSGAAEGAQERAVRSHPRMGEMRRTTQEARFPRKGCRWHECGCRGPASGHEAVRAAAVPRTEG